MTRVDFYVLPDSDSPDRFACVLSNKIRKQGLPIYIHTDNHSKALKIDELLWTFRDISFLPHTMEGEPTDDNSQIKIGWNEIPPDSKQVLINLGTHIPDSAATFNRVVEIVVADEESRARSRENYKQYQNLGFDVFSHNLESSHG